ncbi:unnamed protein product [Mytilus coruscus]|uniref:Endonuclease/exonuclease/phosphatase domain-containing protein n=1 Tax=Mytilus coruscus TaxID=42192 RepID=A0A6J8CSN6_MYTCO|nr:unnamed protein product [Mytilus coruscus]
MNEMKIWFLEKKVRQIELDMQKHDTKIMFMKEKLYCSNNNREERKYHTPKAARKRPFKKINGQNHTYHDPDEATDLCTRLDDLIVNISGDEADFHQDDRAYKSIENLEEIKQTEISEQQKTDGGNNIIQQTNIQPATNCKQIPSDNTTASDTTLPICPINTITILDASSNNNPVTSSNDNSTSPDATSIPIAKPACQSNKCTLSLLTFNVEGYRSNKLYLEKISNRADIIFVQEHWLYKHEKHIIGTEFSEFQCHAKSFDED